MTNELFPKLLECDLAILATPLFHYTVNAQMKTFIERTLPIALPFFEKRDGVTRHPLRHTPPPVVIISVAGFPEEGVFDQLRSYANFLYGDRLVAQIYRTSAELLRRSTSREAINDVLEATVQGGRELAESMKISPETMARIEKPLTDFDKMAPLGNLMWQTCIDEGITVMEFQKKKMIPRPDSIETFMAIMKVGFNPRKAANARVTFQFNFSGQVEGACYVAIENGTITPAVGTAESPDLTIDTPFEVWMDILTRKADGQQMSMEGKYKVKGDISILMRMNEFFGE
jgi:putative sterol carrier protein